MSVPVSNRATLRTASHRPGTAAIAVLSLLVCLTLTGCVQRRLTIRTNPPGALVYIDDYEIGTTPVSTNFLYYGTRKIRLVKDGYETTTVLHRISPPWYQYFPLDFVSENLVPADIRDERTLEFELVPQRLVPTEQLWERAENLRQAGGIGTIVPQSGPQAPSPGLIAPPPGPGELPPPTLPSQGAAPHVLPPPKAGKPAL